jgi:cold shock CspA family protein
MIGRVKKILARGFGFITDEGGEDYFFHNTQFKGDWDALKLVSPPMVEDGKGPEVQFKVVDHKRGPRAEKVELIEL